MERNTLKFLRFLIPGLILIIEFSPMLKFVNINYTVGEGWMSYSILIIPALVIGAIYHFLDFRFSITNVSHKKIDLNIVNSLLKIYNKPISHDEHNYLKDKRLKHIFYYFIDKDESLTAKSQLIYFNGLLWTSTADLFILSIFSCIVFLICGLCFSNDLILLSVAYAFIALLAFCFHASTIKKHLELSNEQLEYIETHYKSDLESKIEASLKQK
jgi:hypothetical protein